MDTRNKKIVSSLYENSDVLVFLALIPLLMRYSLQYSPNIRLFPLLFLGSAWVFLAIELVIKFVPGRTSELLQDLTAGLAEDFDEETMKNTPGEENDLSESPIKEDVNRSIAPIVVMILSFVLLTYLFGFLLAVPLFVAISMCLMRNFDLIEVVVLSVLFTIIIFVLFGRVMNVPITEGIIVEF